MRSVLEKGLEIQFYPISTTNWQIKAERGGCVSGGEGNPH